jgi:hypothetical protein
MAMALSASAAPGTFQRRWRAAGKGHAATVCGSLADAKRKLRAKLKGADDGQHVAPSRVTVAEQVRSRLDQWKESGDITVTTHDRYSQLTENQIVPAIGTILVQCLTPQDIERGHADSARMDERISLAASARALSPPPTGCSARR